ncbi:hypothetical protein Angca_007615, partial [Angiostrongylus cantonensis]
MYGRCYRVSLLNPWEVTDYVCNYKSPVVWRQFRECSNGPSIREHKDYYDILGVKKDATQEEIKAAFYTKSKQLHPDKGSSAESSERFVEVKLAYDVLRRPAERRAYDMRERKQSYAKFRNPYYHYNQSHQEHTWEWNRFWKQSSDNSENFGSSGQEERLNEQWRFILKWTTAGFVLAVMYNIGYALYLHSRGRRLSKLVDEDEIAKSFMRQPEFRDRFPDTLEIHELGRILKGDVDEAWRRKQEGLEGRNPSEIREEYRWMRALQDADHRRRIKAEKRLREQ